MTERKSLVKVNSFGRIGQDSVPLAFRQSARIGPSTGNGASGVNSNWSYENVLLLFDNKRSMWLCERIMITKCDALQGLRLDFVLYAMLRCN